jgi:hypothetical protein
MLFNFGVILFPLTLIESERMPFIVEPGSQIADVILQAVWMLRVDNPIFEHISKQNMVVG